jgi:uncharacterized repeat protein (TIGR03803 family)
MNLIEPLEPRRLLSVSLHTIATLNADDASVPRTLFADPAGKLYGVSYYGSGDRGGDIFEVDPTTNSLSLIKAHMNDIPAGPLPFLYSIDSAGYVYGSVSTTGAFKIAPGTGEMISIPSLDSAPSPPGTFAVDSAGNRFGTTTTGGDHSDGTIFEIPAGETNATTLASFDGSNGMGAKSLFADGNGNLFGIADGPDANARQVLFELRAGTHTIVALHQFAGTNTRVAQSSLGIDADGHIWINFRRRELRRHRFQRTRRCVRSLIRRPYVYNNYDLQFG